MSFDPGEPVRPTPNDPFQPAPPDPGRSPFGTPGSEPIQSVNPVQPVVVRPRRSGAGMLINALLGIALSGAVPAMIAFAGLQRQADWTDPRRVVARSRIR